MPAYDSDVFIIGGGPAGLAAAIALRQQGFSVTVADCARPPIDKACGEGLMPDSLAALASLGVTLDGIETAPFRGIRFIGAANSVAACFPNGGVGRGIRRILLHSALIDRASHMDVDLRWGVHAQAVTQGTVLVDGRLFRARWIVGADGHNSQLRKFAGLDRGHEYGRRMGLRRHYAVRPWSDFAEIHWGEHSQAYVTPISFDQVCVAIISKRRIGSFESELKHFPKLSRELDGAVATTPVRGAITVSRHLRRVATHGVALVGEASGSADAITGEGLAVCFRQALALARALGTDPAIYHREHRNIMRLPHFMAGTMLLMDKSSSVQTRALRVFESQPAFFDRMLSVHVGEMPLSQFGLNNALNFGWQLLTS